MHKRAPAASLYVTVSVVLLGLLLSSLIAPVARIERNGRVLSVFSFLIEFEKSLGNKSLDSDSFKTNTPSYTSDAKLKKQQVRLYLTQLPHGALGKCMIANIFFGCCCVVLALALIITTLVDISSQTVFLKSTCNPRMVILIGLALACLGRFVTVVVMVVYEGLYAGIENGYFTQESQLKVRSGFIAPLSSTCLCILAIIGLWATICSQRSLN